MMNYDEFKEYVVNHIKDYMPEEYQDRAVDLHRVNKINGAEMDGITIRDMYNPISPNVYLNNYYEQYRNGQDVMPSEVTQREEEGIALLQESVQTNVGEMPVRDYLEMEASKIGYDSYKEMLEDGVSLTGYESISSDVIRLDSVMRDISSFYIQHERVDFNVSDVDWVNDFEQAKDSIIPRIMNRERNEHILNERPHIDMDDLAITYAIRVKQDANGLMSVPLDNNMMRLYGTNVEELRDIAVQNMRRMDPCSCRPMVEVIRESMLGNWEPDMEMTKEEFEQMIDEMFDMGSGQDIMYVVTNSSGVNGAAAILDDELMEQVREQIGDVYVLPSSLHELILVPKEIGQELVDLKNIVQEANVSAVSPADYLSDNIYEYDYETKLLRLADRTQEQNRNNQEASYEDAVDNILETMYQQDQAEMVETDEMCL